jgi:hypothetical protein
MSDTQLSERLGYANPTTLSSVRRGVVFPDVERLAQLGRVILNSGISPNLHWIITGDGTPFLQSPLPRSMDANELEALNRVTVMKLATRRAGEASHD